MHDASNSLLEYFAKIQGHPIISSLWKAHNNKIRFQTKDDAMPRPNGNGSIREEKIIETMQCVVSNCCIVVVRFLFKNKQTNKNKTKQKQNNKPK